ncbi:MAG: hypothetical protein GAK29_01024 [Acinetobacter bereziniae]|uniref:Pre-toxin TG domain-containing protein n=1 Tax=Acinetobacter bereziniae TaxID=106648 RepID=A0A833UX09_ACIBZ|nr:MAG: hypothetical protein GAK29_01024 [Acinetobacter bereziniae]
MVSTNKQQIAQVIVDIFPLTSDPSAIYSIITGKTIVTNEEVSRFYAGLGLILPITLGRGLTKAEMSGLKRTADSPIKTTISAKDLQTLPQAAQKFITEQAADRVSAKLLLSAKNDPNLKSWSRQKIGDTGEIIAVQMVKGSGYTDVISIQNRAGNGIDIIAKSPQGNYTYMEVKTSAVGNIGPLTKGRQDDMNFFLKDVLANASNGTGRYTNLDLKIRDQAKTMYAEFLKTNSVKSTTGTAIGIDLKNGVIRVSPWDRK